MILIYDARTYVVQERQSSGSGRSPLATPLTEFDAFNSTFLYSYFYILIIKLLFCLYVHCKKSMFEDHIHEVFYKNVRSFSYG